MPDDLNLTNNNSQASGSPSGLDGLSSTPGKSPLEEASQDMPEVKPETPAELAPEPPQADVPAPEMPAPDAGMPEEPTMPEPAPEAPSTDPLSGLGLDSTGASDMSSAQPPAESAPEPQPLSDFTSTSNSTPEPAAESTPDPAPEPASPVEIEPTPMPTPEPTPETPAVPPAETAMALESDSAPAAEMPMPEEPVSPIPDATPTSPIDQPAPAPQAEEPAAAPDTDEFLKNILANSQEPTQEPPKPEETAPAVSEEPQPAVPSLGSAPEPMQSEQTSGPGGFNPQTVSGGSTGYSPAPSLDSVGAPRPDESGNPVSGDVVGAMQKPASPAGGQKSKLIILIIVALIIVIGGYLAYTKLLNPSQPAATTDTVSPTTQETSINVSNDQVRKQDMQTIQQALLNLYAAENKYPVSAETIFLTGTSNVVAKALVNYLPTVPVDPDPQKNYAYKSADGTTFALTAVLDDTSDPVGILENGLYLMKVEPATVITLTNTTIDGPADPTSGADDLSGALPTI